MYSIVAVVIAASPFIPFILRRGFGSNFRVATCIACFFALVFGLILAIIIWELVETRGAVGARGEGSPLAMIVAMTIVALLVFCPWLLTAIRGLRSWNLIISEHDAPSNGG